MGKTKKSIDKGIKDFQKGARNLGTDIKKGVNDVGKSIDKEVKKVKKK